MLRTAKGEQARQRIREILAERKESNDFSAVYALSWCPTDAAAALFTELLEAHVLGANWFEGSNADALLRYASRLPLSPGQLGTIEQLLKKPVPAPSFDPVIGRHQAELDGGPVAPLMKPRSASTPRDPHP
jgi:hypothetical protein